MKIYDCFTFYAEMDLLELRLQELYEHVDHFVIVEGDHTFTNTAKPYNFEVNQARYQKYLDKIIYIKVKMPMSASAWTNEIYQRNSIAEGIVDAADDDIIMITDLDEVVRPATVDAMRADVDNQIWGLRMPLFYFRFNHMLTTTDSRYSVWGMAGRKSVMMPAEDFRKLRFSLNGFGLAHNDSGVRLMEHAGWHFSYLGNNAAATQKIQSFAHTETNRPEVLAQLDVERSVANGDGLGPSAVERFAAINLDEYFPKTVLDNPGKYATLTVTGTTQPVWNFLPQI